MCLSSFQTHLRKSLGRRDMLIKIILNIDAIPGDTNLTMSNSFTILHLFWNVYFKKHVSGILPREDPLLF